MKVRIKLNKANAVITGTKEVTTFPVEGPATTETVDVLDWIPALKMAAQEIQLLNTFVGTPDFPLPVTSNPASMVWIEDELVGEVTNPAHWEGNILGFIGDCNGLPSDDGRLEVEIANYSHMDLDRFPAMPTTFTFSEGLPPTAGKIL